MPDLLATRWGRLTAFVFLYMTKGIPLGFTATALATQSPRSPSMRLIRLKPNSSRSNFARAPNPSILWISLKLKTRNFKFIRGISLLHS